MDSLVSTSNSSVVIKESIDEIPQTHSSENIIIEDTSAGSENIIIEDTSAGNENIVDSSAVTVGPNTNLVDKFTSLTENENINSIAGNKNILNSLAVGLNTHTNKHIEDSLITLPENENVDSLAVGLKINSNSPIEDLIIGDENINSLIGNGNIVDSLPVGLNTDTNSPIIEDQESLKVTGNEQIDSLSRIENSVDSLSGITNSVDSIAAAIIINPNRPIEDSLTGNEDIGSLAGPGNDSSGNCEKMDNNGLIIKLSTTSNTIDMKDQTSLTSNTVITTNMDVNTDKVTLTSRNDSQDVTNSLVSYEYSSSDNEDKDEDVRILEPEILIKEEPEDIEDIQEMEVENEICYPSVCDKARKELIKEVTFGPSCSDPDIVMIAQTNNVIGDYRKVTDVSGSEEDSSSDSERESSESSDEIELSSDESERPITKNKKIEEDKVNPVVPVAPKPTKKKKKHFMIDEIDLPPIEDLQISVEEKQTKCIGTVIQLVDSQVVVQSYPNLPAIDLDSILFLDNGKRALGKIFDVFGAIQEPLYVVRFNSSDHVKEKEIEKGALVYFAPETEHTSYIIISDLLSSRGSDASWEDNREPPDKYLDFSDDEEERKAKQSRKRNRESKTATNPFSTNYSQNDSRPSTPRYRNFSDNERNETYTPEPRNFRNGPRFMSRPRFGDPPQFRNNLPQYRPKGEFGGDSYDYYCSTPPPSISPSITSLSPSPFNHSQPDSNFSSNSSPMPYIQNSNPPPSSSIPFPSTSQRTSGMLEPPQNFTGSRSFPSQSQNMFNSRPMPPRSPIDHNFMAPPRFQSRPPVHMNAHNRPSRVPESYHHSPMNPQNMQPNFPHNHNLRHPLPPPPQSYEPNQPPPFSSNNQLPPPMYRDNHLPPPQSHTFRGPPPSHPNFNQPPQSSILNRPPQIMPNLSVPPPANMNGYSKFS